MPTEGTEARSLTPEDWTPAMSMRGRATMRGKISMQEPMTAE
jgi:hypothetical protein